MTEDLQQILVTIASLAGNRHADRPAILESAATSGLRIKVYTLSRTEL